jgi:hypothetical protein
MDGQGKADGVRSSWGMIALRMSEKHQKDSQTINIDTQIASISVNTNQTLKIIVKIKCNDSKS